MLTVFACLFVVLFFRQCEKEDEMVRERKRWDVWMRELIIEQSEKGAVCVVFFFFEVPSTKSVCKEQQNGEQQQQQHVCWTESLGWLSMHLMQIYFRAQQLRWDLCFQVECLCMPLFSFVFVLTIFHAGADVSCVILNVAVQPDAPRTVTYSTEVGQETRSGSEGSQYCHQLGDPFHFHYFI